MHKFLLLLRSCLLLTAVLAVAACSLVPVSHYDGNTDKGLTRLHQHTAEFFVSVVHKEDCGYAYYSDFHQDAKVVISGLLVRARAMPHNSLTVQQLQLLSSSYVNLASLHQLGCLSEAQVADLWAMFDDGFSAVLRLELAKKYGAG